MNSARRESIRRIRMALDARTRRRSRLDWRKVSGLVEAVRKAKDFITRAIRTNPGWAAGLVR